MDPVLVEVMRGSHVESVHRGAVALVDADGAVALAFGDIDAAVFPRSAVKALQALPLVEGGAADQMGLTDAEIALACSSHNGEPAHVAAALSMLRKAGRDGSCLECGAHWPSYQPAALALACEGGAPLALHNNCSGKHAGFICVACDAGEDPSGYIGPDHPTMRRITAALAGTTGTVLDERNRGTDGCSIPTYAIPLRALALAFARFGTGNGFSRDRAAAAARIRAAVAANPFMVAGTGRFDTVIMQALGARLFAKTGAEGVHCGALPELGFDEAWVGEHFSAMTEQISSPLMFMAALLRVTKNIRFGTGVIGLPNHHPAIVAAEVALFDHMSKGRLLFGIGPAGLSSDHELFGNSDPVIRGERMMESIDIILRIWAQDPPYDIVGKHFQVRITESIVPSLGVGYLPKPYQQPHPPIVMSAMSPHSQSVATAAARGWDVVSANFTPEYTLATHWRKFQEGCVTGGHTPDGRKWRVARNILVAESDQQALDWAMDPQGSNYYYFSYLWDVLQRANYTVVMKPDPAKAHEELTIEGMISSMVVFGSSRTVAEKLAAMRTRIGPFGTLLMASMDGSGVNHEREQATMRRLATEVVPMLKAMIGT